MHAPRIGRGISTPEDVKLCAHRRGKVVQGSRGVTVLVSMEEESKPEVPTRLEGVNHKVSLPLVFSIDASSYTASSTRKRCMVPIHKPPPPKLVHSKDSLQYRTITWLKNRCTSIHNRLQDPNPLRCGHKSLNPTSYSSFASRQIQ